MGLLFGVVWGACLKNRRGCRIGGITLFKQDPWGFINPKGLRLNFAQGGILFLTILPQISNFQFDRNSFLLGLLAGGLLALLLYKLSPFLRRLWGRMRGWVTAKLLWMRSGVEERFQGETAVYTEKLHLGNQWAGLSSVFVEPRLTAALEDPALLPEDRGATHFAALWPELAERVGAPVPASMSVGMLLRNGRRVLITGAGGAGKSTLLAHLTHLVATAEAESELAMFVPFVPILLDVTALDLQLLDEETPIITPLVQAVQRRSSPITSPGIGDMVERKLADGHLILFLDGWDELPAGERPSLRAWLGDVIQTYRSLRLFVATGLDGYGSLLEMNFTVTSILPWRVGQVQALVDKWQPIFPQEEETALAITDFWQAGQTVWETTVRFWLLLLTDGERPSRHVDLMAAAILVLHDRKHKAGEPYLPPDEEVLSFWELLAFTMLKRPSCTLSTDEIKELLEPSVAEDADDTESKNIGGKLRKSLSSNGLFVKTGNQIGFQSTIWRDYFAGCYLAKQGLEDVVTTHLNDPAWQGAVAVYVAQNGATPMALPLLQKRAESLTQEPLFQVAGWMSQATDGGEWRRQTMIALGQLLRQEDVPTVLRLRAMAAMTLTGEAKMIDFLAKLLSRTDPFLRQMGTMVLPALPDNQVVGMLANMLADEDGIVRETAVHSLMLIQSNPLTERPIITALIGEDEEASLLSAELLALSGQPGIEILREAVADEDIQVRRAALHGLQQVDADWLEPMMVDIEREDDEWFVRSAANGALEALRQRKEPIAWYPLNPKQIDWLADFAVQQGYELADRAGTVAVLLQMLKEAESSRWRVLAALLLAYLPSPGTQAYLETAVRDEDVAVREAAFVAFVRNERAYEG